MIDCSDAAGAGRPGRDERPHQAGGRGRPANLILIEQSGVKRQIPQPSALSGMIEAQEAMNRHGNRLREVKVVSRHKAIARWKAGGLGWRRVA